MKNRAHVYGVVLVGGKGKRLAPLSNDARPKAFLSVTRDRKTMFAKTLQRISKVVPKNDIIVVANRAHESLVKKDLPGVKKDNILLEPCSRNTAPAITLAASALAAKDEDAIMVVLPTDQYIADQDRYIDTLKRGIGFVRKNADAIVVVGVKPTSPSVELGYVRVQGAGSRGQDALKVEKFTEKPALAAAKRYLDSGKYLWNTGAFIFRADAFLEEVKKFAPKIYRNLKDNKNFEKKYAKLADISVDYAIMERSRNVYCVKGKFDWCDMGSFGNLEKILRRELRIFITKDGRIIKII